MRKFFVAIGVLFTIGLLSNPENAYIGKEVEMIAIDADHLQDENGMTYVADRELFVGEKYIVKLEIHSDRTIIADYIELN